MHAYMLYRTCGLSRAGEDDTQGLYDAWLCALEYCELRYGILLNGRVGWGGMVEREGEGREIPVGAGKDGGLLGWRFGMWW